MSRMHLPLSITLTSPLHHGAGVAGNTSLLRTQRIIRPDGSTASVPFVSGNSMRHQVRAALAWHAARVLELPEGALSKPVVDLLWSGGAITRTGSETRLDLIRRVEALYPPLTLLGYSAGSDMVAGVLAVNNLHLVCRENTWRLDSASADTVHADRPAAVFRGEEFGTRHDTAGTATDRITASVVDTLVGATPTTQMIYDMQVLVPGSVLSGSMDLSAAATHDHRRVLAVALDEMMPMVDGRRTVALAAKTAVGYGAGLVEVDLSTVADLTQARDWWESHLREHREDILDVWNQVIA